MINLDSGVRRFDTVFVVALLTLFALTASILVLISAKQYNITAEKMNTNYESRTVSSYLREKTRQSDANGQIVLELFQPDKTYTPEEALAEFGKYFTEKQDLFFEKDLCLGMDIQDLDMGIPYMRMLIHQCLL